MTTSNFQISIASGALRMELQHQMPVWAIRLLLLLADGATSPFACAAGLSLDWVCHCSPPECYLGFFFFRCAFCSAGMLVGAAAASLSVACH